MRRLFLCILIFVLTAGPATVHGRESGVRNSVFSDYLDSNINGGFINIPGLQFKSSMGVSYFSSGDYSSSMGYYMGHFTYEFGSSWDLNVDVGVSSRLDQNIGTQSPQLFVPNIDLTYRPSKKFMLRLHFSRYNYPMFRRYSR